MKLRNYLELLGLRGKARRYAYETESFDLRDGPVTYARWLHPKEVRKDITDAQVDAYREYVSPGDFCIDIGAHSGDSTLPMAIAAGRSGLVLAMEPNPYVYHVLEKNVRANRGMTNIEPMMAAVAPREGFLTFEYSDAGYCNGGNHQDIPALTHGHAYRLEVFAVNLAAELEQSFADELARLRFIKVDTEGFDLYVLQSLEPVIAITKPAIKAEVFKDTDAAYRLALLDFLEGLGYTVYRIESEPIGKGLRLTTETVLERQHYDILAVAG